MERTGIGSRFDLSLFSVYPYVNTCIQLDPLKKFHLEPTSDGLYELFVIVSLRQLDR